MWRRQSLLSLACVLSAWNACGCEDEPLGQAPTGDAAEDRAASLPEAGVDGSSEPGDASSNDVAIADHPEDAESEAPLDAEGSAPLELSIGGSLVLPGNAPVLSVCSRGDLALVGRGVAPGPDPEIVILDIGTPAKPRYVSGIDLDASVRAVRLEGVRAYAATSDDQRELVVLDVSDPASAAIVGAYDAPGLRDGTSLDVVGNRAVLGLSESSGPELLFLDVTTPSAIVVTAQAEVGADVNDVELNDLLAYVATSDPQRPLRVFDYSIFGGPVELWSFEHNGRYARALDVNDQRLYALLDHPDGSEMLIFGAPSESIPTLIASKTIPGKAADLLRYGAQTMIAGELGLSVVSEKRISETNRDYVDPLGALRVVGGLTALDSDDHLLFLGNGPSLLAARTELVPRVEDVNGDGYRTLCILGDSNSKRPDDPTWVDDLAALLEGSNWRVVNRAEPYAVTFSFDGHPNAWAQLQLALAEDQPDAIILAFGSNDIALALALTQLLGVSADQSFAGEYAREVRKLRAHAAARGVLSFVALTPPLTAEADAASITLVHEFNHRIRNELDPVDLIDFFSTMVMPDDFIDAIHLGPSGMAKRAREAHRKLVP